jgi:hypothetical protein
MLFGSKTTIPLFAGTVNAPSDPFEPLLNDCALERVLTTVNPSARPMIAHTRVDERSFLPARMIFIDPSLLLNIVGTWRTTALLRDR